jgi:hypothetical protein
MYGKNPYTFSIKERKPNNRGRRKNQPGISKEERCEIRMSAAEKQAFSEAAQLDGKKLSEWIRDRLRRTARQELQEAGLNVAFLVEK